jgi:hypothetical protein
VTRRGVNLLLHLHHPQIAFGLGVVEGHGEILEEAEHSVTVGVEPVPELGAGRAPGPPARVTRSGGGSAASPAARSASKRRA